MRRLANAVADDSAVTGPYARPDARTQRGHRLDDIANAERFAEMHADRVRFDFVRRAWFVYDGRRWKRDDANDVQELAKQTARAVAADAGSNRARKQQARMAGSMTGLKNMLALATSIPALKIHARQWDADPDVINLENGTFDLRTLTLRPHTPADRITKLASVAYDPTADCPLFRSILSRYFLTENTNQGPVPLTGSRHADGQTIIRLLQTCIGYRLSGREVEKVFMLLHGTGNTGKTTLMQTLKMVWGDYFADADWNSFARQRDNDGNKHRTDLVRLAGARIVSASEGDEGVRLAEGTIKRFAGGRQGYEVRDLHGKPFTLRSTFTIYLDTNHLPAFTGHDQAIWNRLVVIFFRNEISTAERERFEREHGALLDALAREVPGILNWAIEGWTNYLNDGRIVLPPVVEAQRKEYQDMVDVLGHFIEERCLLGPQRCTESKAIYEQYKAFIKDLGETVHSHRTFSQRMRERGFMLKRSASKRYIWGISLVESELPSANDVPV